MLWHELGESLYCREASAILAGPADIPAPPATLEQDIRDALLASKIISYAQV
jgi:6-phosphogluconate dehydrogenase